MRLWDLQKTKALSMDRESLFSSFVGRKLYRKNLLRNEITTVSQNGVTVTKNADGTLNVTTTTVTANTEIIIGEVTRDATKVYTISGCPEGGSSSTYRQIIRLRKDGSSLQAVSDTGNGYTLQKTTQPTAEEIRVCIMIAKGQNNLELLYKPMVEYGSSKTEYEPY